MVVAVLLNKDVRLAPGTRVVKAADYQALLEAEALIAAARERAAAIEAEAHAAYEAEKARGYADGQAEASMAAADTALQSSLAAVEFLERVEREIGDLVLISLEKIVGTMDSDELIRRVVRQALTAIRNEQEVTLRVSQDEAEVVREQIEALVARFPGLSILSVTGEPRLARGECQLITPVGVIDAGVDTQLAAIRRAVEAAVGRRQPAEG